MSFQANWLRTFFSSLLSFLAKSLAIRSSWPKVCLYKNREGGKERLLKREHNILLAASEVRGFYIFAIINARLPHWLGWMAHESGLISLG